MAKPGGKAAPKGGRGEKKPTRKRTAAKPAAKKKDPTGQRGTKAKRNRSTKRTAAAAEVRSAREVVEEAQAKGAARTVENAKLYQALFHDWQMGYTWPELAGKHKLSERRCREVVEDLKPMQLDALRLQDPLFGLRMANDLVLRYAARIGEYARLADEQKGPKRTALKLGFLKRRDDALREFTDLLQELGWLPKNLGTVRVAADLIGMADAILDELDRHEVPEHVQRAVIEAMELRVTRHRGKLALDMTSPIDSTATEVGDAEPAAA